MAQKYCTIYIVRHGQTDANQQKIIQGQTDTHLNETGINEARLAAELLSPIQFEAIFSSDLSRAKRTAEIIKLEREIAIQTTQTLRERRYGALEGKSATIVSLVEQLKDTLSYPERLSYRESEDIETDAEMVSRVITFLREVAVAYLNKTVLIVSHNGVMRVLMDHLGMKVKYGTISNAAYVKLESDGVDFFIKETKGITTNV